MPQLAKRATKNAVSDGLSREMIGVDNLTKIYVDRFRRPVRALDRISLEVYPGEFASLLGPSGCGKSTMLLLIAGLVRPSEGLIRVSGRMVTSPQTHVGIVFQNDVLLEWRSALDNVMLQMEARGLKNSRSRERAQQLLSSMGLGGFEDSMPHELSGGMRQRVALCRAQIHDPPLLLMDEPFGSLDALTRDQLGLELARQWDLEQRRQKTALFITHSIPEAVFLSDRITVMTPRPGRVREIVDIHLPRPRTLGMRETPEFHHLVAKIENMFVMGGTLKEWKPSSTGGEAKAYE